MPELPEVEYVARQLRGELVGRRIERVEVSWPRIVAGMAPEELAARVAGRMVTGIGRRGKYLLIALEGGETLIVHRRMSGNLTLAPLDAADPYVRAAFALDDGRRLLYSDPRKFGRITLAADADLPRVFAALGPEPLDDEAFTAAALAARLAGTKRPIKAALLDQGIVAGLGNIYADEALFRARIHPLRPADSLTPSELAALREAIQAVLLVGIAHGGTTFGRHRDVYNEAGTNLEHLLAYRKTGQPCPRCGTPIARIVVAQRGTHYCPHCQRIDAR
jgi:formamidopyrimidine-DNA glycosylase